MSKEGQIWDDSALINAFDQAISKYKKMHGKGYKDCLTNDVSADVISSNSDVPQIDNMFESDPEKVGDGNDNSSNLLVEVEEDGYLGTVIENEVTDSQISKEHDLEPCSLPPQDQYQMYSSSINLDEYNMLYKQYYEIEEQRQHILQKMQQYTNEYYPDSVQWGANSATPEYQGTRLMPYETTAVSCCPCACQCSAASCGTNGANPPTTKGIEVNTPVENVDFVAAALGAAEKALSTLHDKTHGSEMENKLRNVMEQNADSETDLSTVLHAWYSAGLYTGKYLTEKSLAKKRHD
ncbi:hypothetical protein RND81_08G146400 [Saponaria officinalis]|uniref:Survival Motor Neuron Gemin2-binding domain-containing protein n=1 Tax=Saponaria officinalis TaxID=3572 RepID=A0AAW1JAW4_SAPOF